MTRKEWAIIGVLGTAVVIVFCIGGLMVFATLARSQTQVVIVEVTSTPEIVGALPTIKSATTVQPTLTAIALLTATKTPQPIATSTAMPTSTSLPTNTPTNIAPSFEALCKQDSSRTAIQVEAELAKWVGKKILNWQGWVYDVQKTGAAYTMYAAMESQEQSFLWSRDIELVELPLNSVSNYNKNQKIVFSGTIKSIDNAFGVYCNPIVVQGATIKPQ